MSDIFLLSYEPYQNAYDAYRKDLDEIITISNRLVASAEGVDNEPTKDLAKLEKLKTIKSQMEKLVKPAMRRGIGMTPRSTLWKRRAYRN